MSVLASQPLASYESGARRRCWQQSSRNQHSFSLDFPKNLYNTDSFSRGLDNLLFQKPLRTREEDRFFLYLPRNLSYCEVCSDVIRDHVQKKVILLSNRLCQYEDVPPTPVDTGFGNDDDDDGGLWTGKIDSALLDDTELRSSIVESSTPHPILKKKKRAFSFPAPRREGSKVVRFADALGLELESIRYLVNKDILAVVPSASGQKAAQKPHTGLKKIQLMPAFLVPSLSMTFMNQLRQQKVCLHSVSTADSTVYGIVSVVNLTFHKMVFIRYTANAWFSHHDEIASYLEGSSENDTDKFSFTLYCNPSDLCSRGHSLFFAVCYQTAEDDIYWDNNNGKNYCIKCEIKDIPKVGNHSWIHFL